MCRLGKAKVLSIFLCPALPTRPSQAVVVVKRGLDWDREKWRGSVASKFIRGGEKNAVKYADEIIVLSKDVQKYFLETYGRETHFIPNGVNRPEVREAKLITDHFGLEKDSYILFLGRLVPEKGIRYLVEAFKNVKTDKKLVIAGGSSDTDISTDYVFDGQGTEPWQPDCKDYKPLNVYGQTKLEGELAVSQTLEKYFIVRIAWVFGLNGKNFIKGLSKWSERKPSTSLKRGVSRMSRLQLRAIRLMLRVPVFWTRSLAAW